MQSAAPGEFDLDHFSTTGFITGLERATYNSVGDTLTNQSIVSSGPPSGPPVERIQSVPP